MDSFSYIGGVSVLFNPKRENIIGIRSCCELISVFIIVDNSKESNEDMVKEIFAGVKAKIIYHPNYENKGLAYALNQGLKIAMQSGVKWCFAIDQDSYFINDVVGEYIEVLKSIGSDSVGIIGPQFDYDNRKLKVEKGFTYTNWMMLSGNMINLEIFRKIGGFNEGFFVDGLDVDYDYRLKENNYKVVECKNAVLKHCPGKRKRIKVLHSTLYYGYDSPFRYYHQARAGIYNGLKHSYAYGAFELGRKLVKIVFLFPNKAQYLHAFISGVKDGVNWYRTNDCTWNYIDG